MARPSAKRNLTDVEKANTTHFNKNVTRNVNGRFIVKLHFKKNTHQPGKSFTSANRKLLSLEKRLMQNTDLYDQYKTNYERIRNIGHMECTVNTGGDKNIIHRLLLSTAFIRT